MPDLSDPGTGPYHDPYDADGKPLPPQAYNGSKDVYGRPICAPAPILPGNGGQEIAGSPWLTDPNHPLYKDHPSNAPVVDPTLETTRPSEPARVPGVYRGVGVEAVLIATVDETGELIPVAPVTS